MDEENLWTEQYTYGTGASGYWPVYSQHMSCPQVTVSTNLPATAASLGSAAVSTASGGDERSVTITVKVINPDKKSDYKTFLIRNIDMDNLDGVNGIRSLLKEELGDQYLPKGLHFDIGFFKGNKQVWMRNDKDAEEVLRNLRMKYECTLWCSGKTDKQKAKKRPAERDATDSNDSDSEQEQTRKKKKKTGKRKTMQEEKRERTDDTVDELVEKHTKYTHLQYRVWAETIVARRHDSFDEPPKGTFFRGKVAGKSSTSAQLPSHLLPLQRNQIQSHHWLPLQMHRKPRTTADKKRKVSAQER